MDQQVKCEKCGKEFGGEHALKVHAGKVHGRRKKAARRGRKAGRGGRRGGLVCQTCGRRFALAMHLARHRAAAHGQAGRRGGLRRVGRVAAGVEVSGLSVEQLLSLKAQVDDRLRQIAQQMRSAKVGL
jgi:DNA-directed RNA polymerase subunit RPC12/RpoP